MGLRFAWACAHVADVLVRKLLRCIEEIRMSVWPQKSDEELNGVFRVSEEQIFVRRVRGLLYSPSTVRPVRENKWNSSIENRSTGVKVSRMYYVTTSPAVHSEIRLNDCNKAATLVSRETE